MAEHSFNLSEFVSRMGLKRVSEFPIIERVQPVALVGDLSPLVPAYAPPAAFFGRLVPLVAGQHTIATVQSLGAGGCFILFVTSTTVGGWQLGTFPADPAPLIAGAPAVNQVSNELPVSVVRDGTILVATRPMTTATHSLITSGELIQSLPFFVPRGFFFTIQAATAAIQMVYMVLVADVPASEGGR